MQYDTQRCSKYRQCKYGIKNINDPISVMPHKVAKASTIVTIVCCWHQHFNLKNCQCYESGHTWIFKTNLRTVLTLATLGDATQTEMILSVSCHPRYQCKYSPYRSMEPNFQLSLLFAVSPKTLQMSLLK